MTNEQTPNNETRQLQCAACGLLGNGPDFYNSAVHTKFKICPNCGTVRFVCQTNEGYRSNTDSGTPAHIRVINRIPSYSVSLRKRSKHKIQEVLRKYEYDEDFIEEIDDRFCEGFGVARDIIIEMLKEQYWAQQTETNGLKGE